MQNLELRCMAEGRNGEWFAVCIDLDIAVEGRSFLEVRQSLQQAMKLYLNRVAELPEEERQQLLARRSPWHVRAKFALSWLRAMLGKQDNRKCQFTVPRDALAA
jgi:hypothetical protein